MTPMFKKYGQLIFVVVGALAILATAWLGKGTAYENAFFYVFSVWLILFSVFGVYSKKKKDPDQ